MNFRTSQLALVFAILFAAAANFGQSSTGAPGSRSAAADAGSRTAKNGFRNEDEIAAKFNNWSSDPEARTWLAFMGYKPENVTAVSATKPHGEKADIVVHVRTRSGERAEGISIKLVSGAHGFNQVDKRWLRQYAKMWRMPADVEAALSLFVGETPPGKPSRDPGRMFLDELEPQARKSIVDFFTAGKTKIATDLFRGEGEFSAPWLMVALKSSDKPRWVLRSIDHVIRFYTEGPVEITRQGNLKIGRITMQRKGGDGGRETAKMLQFKINPALLF